MVVLDTSNMITAGTNQYLQPDYLSPLPTTLDAKKSPLALLAQTCSQIGADTSNSKPLIPPLEKARKDDDRKEKGDTNKLAFKPYDLCRKDDAPEDRSRKSPSSKSTTPSTPTPATPTSITSSASSAVSQESRTSTSCENKTESTTTTSSSSSSTTSPIIRSGLEVLSSHPKDLPLGTYKLGMLPGLGMAGGFPLPPYGLIDGVPLRAPGLVSVSSALPGYPPVSSSPYLSYARAKSGDSLMPMCRDPYCTGCQYAVHGSQMLASAAAAASCANGCSQCDHAKPGLPGLPPLIPGLASSAAAGSSPLYAPPSSLVNASQPYVCNWIAGDRYCGKRFTTSEELLQHLRTHTNLSASDAALPLLNPALSHPALLAHRAAYPAPSLSPLSAARYHPYSKPSLPSIPHPALTPLPPHHPTLAPYYSSPYSLYSQRLGAAALP